MGNDNSISLNKFISSTGICSRREADKMINAGRVMLNGKVAKTGNRVLSSDSVTLDGRIIKDAKKPVYLAFNKPIGIVCTTEKKEKNNIIDYVNYPERLFPIGRLDKPSEGLIFLTNDGDVVNKILRAGNNHEKEYLVHVDRSITDDFLKRMASGIPILGTKTKKCHITKSGDKQFKIVLTQGLNRQIRRMCTYLGFEVTKLKRTRIMNVRLAKLRTGEWRELSDEEMKNIRSLTETSLKTKEASKDKNRKGFYSKRKK